MPKFYVTVKINHSRRCVRLIKIIYSWNFVDAWDIIVKMTSEVQTRDFIIRLYQENPGSSQKTIARKAKVAQKTISNVIKNFKERLTVTRKVGSGRKKGFKDSKIVKKVVDSLSKNPGTSNRKLAGKACCSESTVRRIKKKVGLRSYKVQTVPDRNAAKNVEAQKRALKLKRDFFQKKNCCIMDDETYVLCDFSQLPGQEFYSATERGKVAEEFRTKKKTKFPKKYLIWQAICSCGLRSQSFVTSGSVNSEIYIKECLQKRLLPFLRKHRGSTFFWPDLASCHYSNATLEWYKANGVVFVPKDANPPNCPELRPIERYWALVKRELKATKKTSKDKRDFGYKWSAAARKVPETTIKALMEGIPGKIEEFRKK